MMYYYIVSFLGALPPTVYFQIDGGSENANKYTLAICELLIARRLCRRIILTRLPVGHTHDDIDAKFGKLWVGFRCAHIFTPQVQYIIVCCSCIYWQYLHSIQEFERKMRQVLGKEQLPFKVVDVFVVPDYKKLLKKCIDKDLSA